MPNQLISIITVILNAEKQIPKLINVLEHEDQELFEWICVDGLSKDSSLDLINNSNVKNLKSISEEDSGIYDAMNKGAKLAAGKWLLFLNADDLLFPGAVRSIHTRLSRLDENFSIVSFGTLILNGHKFECISFSRPWMLFFKNSIPHPSTLILKQVFNNYQYDASYKICGDYDLFFRMIKVKNENIKIFKDLTSIHFRGGASSDSVRSSIEESSVMTENSSLANVIIFVKISLRKLKSFRLLARTPS